MSPTIKRISTSRDTSVELARLIACLIIVGVHSVPYPVINGTVSRGSLGVSFLVADGVGIFWLIYGFFAYRKQVSYKKLMAHMARRILLPLVVITLFLFYFSHWLEGSTSLVESLHRTPADYAALMSGIRVWQYSVPYTGHLWYLYVYVLLVMCQPLVCAAVAYLDEDVTRQRAFVAVSFALLLMNDVSNNELFVFSHHTIGALVPATIIAIYGHMLYSNRAKLCQAKARIALALLYVLSFAVRYAVQLRRFRLNPTGYGQLLNWSAAGGAACAICLAGIALSLAPYIDTWPSRLRRVINYFGSLTFLVYLVHAPILGALLPRTAFQAIIDSWPAQRGFIGQLQSDLLHTLVAFALSLVVAIALHSLALPWHRFTQGVRN